MVERRMGGPSRRAPLFGRLAPLVEGSARDAPRVARAPRYGCASLEGPAIPKLLGIDVGGTKTAFALGDLDGSVSARRRRPTEPSGDARADLDRMAADARSLLAEAGLAATDLAAVGVSLPGPLDPEAGRVLSPPNLPGWHDTPVRDRLQDALGVRVFLENDANAAALAEWHFGAGRGLRHMVYLTMSTGVGGGLVLDGRIHRGVLASAGELGHVPVEWDGEPCACGRRGCLEAYVGGASWTRRLRAVAPESSRAVALAGSRDALTPRQLVAAAHEGDAFALAEMKRWNGYVARGIVTVVMLLAPEAVVLGTIAVAAGEALAFEPIRAEVAGRIWPHLAERLRIVPAALGRELPYLAGVSVAVEGLRGAL
jgi:glucokinase